MTPDPGALPALSLTEAVNAELSSGREFVALLPLVVLVVGFVVYCLVDLARANHVQHLPKAVWALLIVAFSPPFGAIAYLVLGKDRYSTTTAPSGTTATLTTAREPQFERRRPVALTTDRLTRDYGGTGLFDVSLRVPTGSVYGLVGPNGAGKTTLLSIVTGMRHADAGTVDIDVSRHRVAVCPDVPEFDGWLTAYEVVDLARSYVASDLGSGDVLDALDIAGLGDVPDRHVGGFSRGMTQRLGLAAALVAHPDLLILDEPTSALDPAGRADVLALVASLRGHATVVFSSHILADVERVADHVGVLRDGRLIYQGSTQALVDEYLQPRWHLRLASDPAPVIERLRSEPWAVKVEPHHDGMLVEATSLEAGQSGIPAVLAGTGSRLVSCEPVAADLEAAFLALTGSDR